MKDKETFNANEYNNFDEAKKFNNSTYAPIEIGKVEEVIEKKEETNSMDESYKKSNDSKNAFNEAVSKNNNTLKKPRLSFKDHIIESTGPFNAIVSAATCTVATVAITTTFLSTAPNVDSVKLESGNDYVSYQVSIDSLDLDSNYKLEVSNPNFYYTTDLNVEEVDTLEFIKGYVYGLKPNYKYDFKLLRDNGEVGGYSSYYQTTFYTLKAPDPVSTFEFNYDGQNLSFKSTLSDYYDICSNTYLTYTINNQQSNNLLFDDKTYIGSIPNLDYSSVVFNVYSTFYNEEKLVGQYTYSFTNFQFNQLDSGCNISGIVGDEYKELSNVDIDFIAYDENNEVVEKLTWTVKNSDISIDFNIDKPFAEYSYKVYVKNVSIYESGICLLKPNLNFQTQEIIDSGLKVSADVTSETQGSIVDDDGNIIELTFGNGYFVIPLYDSNNNRYNYSNFNLTIDTYNYSLAPSSGLLRLNDIRLSKINNQFVLFSDGYVTFNDPKQRLKLTITNSISDTNSKREQEVLYLDKNPKTYLLGINATSDIILTYSLVDELDNEVIGEESIETNIGNEFTISSSLSNGAINFGLVDSTNSPGTYTVTLITYDEFNAVMARTLLDDTYLFSDTTYSIPITSDVKGIQYEIMESDNIIYKSNILSDTNIEINEQDMTYDSLYLYASNLDLIFMNGTLTNSKGETVNVKLSDNRIEIPLLDRNYMRQTFTDYTITMNNGFKDIVIADSVVDTFEIIDPRFENSYSANAFQFRLNSICHESDYTINVEAYNGENFVQSDTYQIGEIYSTISALGQFMNDNNASFDTTIKISIVGENTTLYEKSYTILAKDKTTSQVTFNAINCGEVLITYNEDSTINVYIPTGFTCDDPDTFLRVYLDDKYYDTRDKVFVCENLEDKSYALRYVVMKQSESMDMVFEDVNPSGAINEDNSNYLNGVKEENEDGNIYYTLDLTNYVNSSFNKELLNVDGHEFTFDETDNVMRVLVSDTDTTITVHLFVNVNYMEFDAFLENVKNCDPSIVIKGKYYKEFIIILNI